MTLIPERRTGNRHPLLTNQIDKLKATGELIDETILSLNLQNDDLTPLEDEEYDHMIYMLNKIIQTLPPLK